MFYYGTHKVENIILYTENDENYYVVTLGRDAEDNTFYVRVDENEVSSWAWDFTPDSVSDYERVKAMIFNVAFTTDTIQEFAGQLGNAFEDCFDDILVHEHDCEDCDKKDGCEEYLTHKN